MKPILALAVLLMFADLPPAWAQLLQWSAAQGGNDHFYEAVPAPSGITWGDASLSATNRGGYLATVTSSGENDFIFALAGQDTNMWYHSYGPWLGGFQPPGSAEPGGGWSWVTGEPFAYQNWAPGQPNNNAGEDRIQLGGGPAAMSSVWNDLGQNHTQYSHGFVVEYDRHPNAVTINAVRQATNQVQLRWASRTHVQYTIEWTDQLPAGWHPLTTVLGNGLSISVDDPFVNTNRFYRIVAPQ